MANILIFETNKKPQYLKSVDEGQYVVDVNVNKRQQVSVSPDILINPDVSLLANVPIKYWKRSGNKVIEMTTLEKQTVDNVEKQVRIDNLNNYQFDGGELAKILVEEGLITKTKIIDKLKLKEGL